jgi:hypothetical protein
MKWIARGESRSQTQLARVTLPETEIGLKGEDGLAVVMVRPWTKVVTGE